MLSRALSQEGTTQGDPLAMAMYSLGVVPLIMRMSEIPFTRQIWYADDSSVCGSTDSLLSWWHRLIEVGPSLGYFPNPSKTWLLVKDDFKQRAEEIFHDTGVSISSEGRPVLGSPLGTADVYISTWVQEKIKVWTGELSTLNELSKSSPQAVFSALTHGWFGHWTYLCSTCPNIGPLLQPIEDAFRHQIIPSLTSSEAPTDNFRDLFLLPCRHGGLGFPNPVSVSSTQYFNSQSVCKPIVDLVVSQCTVIPFDSIASQISIKHSIHLKNRLSSKQFSESVRSTLSPSLQRLFDIANEKGVSSWLTSLPIQDHGFNLHKRAFWDALCLRYGYLPSSLPTNCSCGIPLSIDHCRNCHLGGFTILRHNGVRDLTARLLNEVCHNATIEPPLQSLSGETLQPKSAITTDNARLDIKADGFWDCSRQSAFFDVRIFNPTAHSSRNQSLPACYRRHELEKRRLYEDRVIQVEHGCFTPLVFSTSGSMGPSASIFYKRLASRLAAKRNATYSSVLSWIRCKISFALIHSAVLCLRGTRTRPSNLFLDFDLALSEGRVTN